MIPIPAIPAIPAAYLYAAAVAFGFLGGWTVQGWRMDADKVDAVQRAIQQQADIAAQDNEIATRFEAARVVMATRTRTIIEKVKDDVEAHPAQYECGLSGFGLCLWNHANAGEAPIACKPDYTMPTPPAGALGPSAGPGGQPRGGGWLVPRMQGPARGPF